MSANGNGNGNGINNGSGRGSSEEVVLESETFDVEQKRVTVELRQNSRGQFVRINEERNGRVERIMIPFSGLSDLVCALQKMEAQGR